MKGGCWACPHDYGYETYEKKHEYCFYPKGKEPGANCEKCWNREIPTETENPLISRLKEILKCEEYVFDKMEHKSAIYILEKDSVLSLTEKHAETTALVEYEKKKAKIKMLKELIEHLENVERRERNEKSAESYTHRKEVNG